MHRWQTTVSGNTIGEIVDAARAEVNRFFQVRIVGDERAFTLDIQPGEIVSIMDAAGRIMDERIDSYQATVTVEL